jgi:cytochrome P450
MRREVRSEEKPMQDSPVTGVRDALFDYFAPAYRDDPYPLYRWLREEDPVHWGLPYEAGSPGAWHVARYADILAIIKDPRFSRGPLRDDGVSTAASRNELPSDPIALYHALAGQSVLFADPPAHTRLRALVSRAFTPRAVEGQRPRIEEMANSLLDAAEARGELDIIGEYALPLTLSVICDLLGVPREAAPQLARWAGVLVRAVDCKETADIYDEAAATAMEVYAFFMELLEQLRRESAGKHLAEDDGLLRVLQVAHERDDRLSETELIVTATTLLIAGHDTTVNLIGNGMLALLEHPDQLAHLRADVAVAESAVEEFLRFDAPSQMSSRYAQEDVEIAGRTIRRGQAVNLLLGSGNRDPEAFAEPDHLDITRRENRHLAFGMGIHYCLGAPLARLEGQVAIPLLVRRYPRLRAREGATVRRDTIGFRGLQRLAVALD